MELLRHEKGLEKENTFGRNASSESYQELIMCC